MGADDLRVASFVASNGVLRLPWLCTEFIVTCTDSLGVHGERNDDRLVMRISTVARSPPLWISSAAMSVSRGRYRDGRVGRSVVDLR
jgi:hypothetical protein